VRVWLQSLQEVQKKTIFTFIPYGYDFGYVEIVGKKVTGKKL
jgi:hypothetical protein